MEKEERSEALGFLEKIILEFSLQAMARSQRGSLRRKEKENHILVSHIIVPTE